MMFEEVFFTSCSQVTLNADYPEPPPLALCPRQMTSMRDSHLHPQTMVRERECLSKELSLIQPRSEVVLVSFGVVPWLCVALHL